MSCINACSQRSRRGLPVRHARAIGEARPLFHTAGTAPSASRISALARQTGAAQLQLQTEVGPGQQARVVAKVMVGIALARLPSA